MANTSSTVGLFYRNNPKASIPLKGAQINARVIDMAVDVQLAMRYVNTNDHPLEVVFVFAQDNSTIYGLQVQIDGKKIVGVCKEKEQAAAEYSDAIASSQSAFLLEKDATQNLFKLNIGNLPPGQEAVVNIQYISQLISEGNDLKLVLPITHMPVLTPSSSTSSSDESGIKDGMHVRVDVHNSQSPIKSIERASRHTVRVERGNTPSDVVILYDPYEGDSTSETFQILIVLADPFVTQLTFEPATEDQTEGAAMFTFYPTIKETLKKMHGEEFQEEDYEPYSELIFLVDQSGSMSGSRIEQAKNALQLFLRSLPPGTMFNIIGFGSYFSKLFPSSVEYDAQTFKRAAEHVSAMSANLGGTEVLPALKDILGTKSNPDYPRQVFCLTDGDVSNTNAVIEYVRVNAKDTRIFTFGIGADASKSLVEGLAKASKGEAEFVNSGTRLEPTVLRQLQRALQPALKNAVIDWGDAALSAKVRQAPRNIAALFDKERATVYAFLDKDVTLEDLRNTTIKLKAQTADAGSTPIEFELRFDDKSIASKGENVVHRLAAAALVREYEDESAEKHKEEIARLGVKYSLASAHTSFVAIHEGQEAVEGTMKQIILNQAAEPIQTASIQSIPAQLASTRAIMLQNIDRVLERGERLENLIDASDQLSAQSYTFQKKASNLNSYSNMFSSMLSSVTGFFSSPPAYESSVRACGTAPAKESWSAPVDEEDQDDSMPNVSSIAPTTTTTTTTTSATATIAPSTPQPSAHTRQFDQLVQLQQFKGNWTPSAALTRVLGLFGVSTPIDASSLPDELKAIDQSEALDAWATAIALAVLEKHCKDAQDEWGMLAAKAQRWLRAFCRQHHNNSATMSDATLLASAASRV